MKLEIKKWKNKVQLQSIDEALTTVNDLLLFATQHQIKNRSE